MKLSKLMTVGLMAATWAMVGTTSVNAEVDAKAKGLEIATEWDNRDLGFKDSTATMKMVLENRHGQKSERKMRQIILEIPDLEVGDKSLTVFDHPRDVKGTAFLSYAKILDPDDQWLYLPALKRVKRISSKNKSGPFVGSEFAYEDLSSRELKKFTYTWLRDEKCGDLDCFVLEQIPTYENSGYTRTEVWYDKDEYRQLKIDFYDRKNALLKTLTYGDYRQYLGKYWRSHDMYVVNHQTGKKTRLLFDEMQFQTGVSDKDLSKNSLKRSR
ncbi:outer membrane lipoprotein-sorting protein [Terasakiella sp. A23]|uniref:outer membrane lipoprotein-sorting protein n=1 Tax=Terasakiella sp. FCG-A23 TaxID=3080561 RepID=UPI0029551EDA|nr:outer membrane lipoprotein-sorting protein [Terasakiella sp. A23]MDV7341793.1 outer membrane lipoprotein-sorting protein [Terasakiella sp. A23]